MPNHYHCSNGERVTQATIDRRRSDAYRKAYQDNPNQICRCSERAQGSSHIVSQQRCKHLHRAELIWARVNFTPACNSCNSRWESNDETVPGYEEFMRILEHLDPEGYAKRLNLKK